MISLLPSYSETIVTTLTPAEVATRLQRVTANSLEWDQSFVVAKDKMFYGYVHEQYFQVALRNTRLISFSPLVFGALEGTSTGCIILLTFRLFILTKLLIAFWSVALLSAAIALAVLFEMVLYPMCILVFLTILHLVAWANFRQQLKPTRRAIFELLDAE